MALFNKKTTLVHHITYMGIMVAINLIFIVLATYIPFLVFLLVLLLPFASAIVSYYCKKRYYPIYAIASIGLCFIFNIPDTIFYVIPAVITGFIIGLLLDKRIHPFWSVLFTSIVECGLTFAFIPLIDLIGNTNIVHAFLSLFRLESFQYQEIITYLFIYFVALLQCIITHYVLLMDIKKIGVEVKTNVHYLTPYIIGLEITLILVFVFGIWFVPLGFVFLEISFYFAFLLLVDLMLSKKPIVYVLLGILMTVSFFGFVFSYQRVTTPKGLLLVSLFPLAICLVSFIKNYLLKCEINI